MNINLLVKWKWRLLFHDPEGWKEVLVAKYGRPITCKVSLHQEAVQRVSSVRWKYGGTYLTKRIGGVGVEYGRAVTVKSTYWLLANHNLGNTAKTEVEPFVVNIHPIWKSVAPSKVCAILWQLLLDRITSRTNLSRRRIIVQGESVDYLLLLVCYFSLLVGLGLAWLGCLSFCIIDKLRGLGFSALS